MHHIHTTDAFILKSYDSREADKRYILFTRELGSIRAMAQGVRFLKSKLRYSLQDFSLSTVSLVRGKEIWRITNARPLANIYTEREKGPDSFSALARIFRLLVRLLPEEEVRKDLFDDLSAAITFISNQPAEEKNTEENILALESVLALKILGYLGYVGNTPELSPFLPAAWTTELLSKAIAHRKQMIAAINESLHHSHL